MAGAMAVALAVTPTLHHLAVLGVKYFLLVRVQRGIEGLGGLFPLVHRRLTVAHVLGTQGNLWSEYLPTSLEDAARYIRGKSRWK